MNARGALEHVALKAELILEGIDARGRRDEVHIDELTEGIVALRLGGGAAAGAHGSVDGLAERREDDRGAVRGIDAEGAVEAVAQVVRELGAVIIRAEHDRKGGIVVLIRIIGRVRIDRDGAAAAELAAVSVGDDGRDGRRAAVGVGAHRDLAAAAVHGEQIVVAHDPVNAVACVPGRDGKGQILAGAGGHREDGRIQRDVAHGDAAGNGQGDGAGDGVPAVHDLIVRAEGAAVAPVKDHVLERGEDIAGVGPDRRAVLQADGAGHAACVLELHAGGIADRGAEFPTVVVGNALRQVVHGIALADGGRVGDVIAGAAAADRDRAVDRGAAQAGHVVVDLGADLRGVRAGHQRGGGVDLRRAALFDHGDDVGVVAVPLIAIVAAAAGDRHRQGAGAAGAEVHAAAVHLDPRRLGLLAADREIPVDRVVVGGILRIVDRQINGAGAGLSGVDLGVAAHAVGEAEGRVAVAVPFIGIAAAAAGDGGGEGLGLARLHADAAAAADGHGRAGGADADREVVRVGAQAVAARDREGDRRGAGAAGGDGHGLFAAADGDDAGIGAVPVIAGAGVGVRHGRGDRVALAHGHGQLVDGD